MRSTGEILEGGSEMDKTKSLFGGSSQSAEGDDVGE